jgi:hypothetical protein
MAQRGYDLLDEAEPFEDAWDDWQEDPADLAEVLREALDDEFADASPEDLDDALTNVLESMSPAEAFSFAKALNQIQRSAGKIASDPVFGQVAGKVLPVAGGALGTVIGGPAGTALGTSLGTAAAKALPAPRAPRPPGPAPTAGVAGGSAAAAQGLVLTQQPDVLKGLLALAMGQHGQRTVSGVPVASIMNTLSSVFGQAAADADELMYLDEGYAEDEGGPALFADGSVYTALLDADNAELADAWDGS